MSLLDTGSQYENCILYPQEVVTDPDGNQFTKPSATGINKQARFQPQGQSGTSGLNLDRNAEGFYTEETYLVRFARWCQEDIGPQATLEWRGSTWFFFGFGAEHTGSSRTSRTTYVIKRS